MSVMNAMGKCTSAGWTGLLLDVSLEQKLGHSKVYLAIVGGIVSVEAGQKVLMSALEMSVSMIDGFGCV